MVSSHNTPEPGLRGLAWAALDRRFAQRYKAQLRTSDGAAAQAALIAGNCWLLTLEKSGTTYLCNALAFRNAIELGIEDQVDFDTIHLGGVFRGTTSLVPTLERLAAFSRVNQGLPLTIHTHETVKAEFARAAMLTRNVFDYCVSAYNFLFANRTRAGRQGVAMDDALPDLVGRYVLLLRQQLEIEARRPDDTVFLRYEDLMSAPDATLARLLDHFGMTSTPDMIARALAAASPAAVKAHEAERGKPIVAGRDFVGASFIRSGAVGEFRQAMTEGQISRIETDPVRAGSGTRRGGIRLSDPGILDGYRPPRGSDPGA